MSVSVSIKVRKEIVELADKMVKYGLARSRNHAFNILIERGLTEVRKEVEYWGSVYRVVEELKKRRFKLSHGGLNKLLAEDRGVD
jgi:metal-responsive CopG/Arc/MetJ family transcriptional regulator